jgi:RNA polymerase sigma factor (sigma-70 family)
MRPNPHELADLLQRARAGCPEAVQLLVERYSDPIRLVIRRHLHTRLRPAFDSVDFLQSVWTDFFARSLQEHDFESPDKLYAFLRRVCLNKVNEAHRKQLDTQKRDRNRETSIPPDIVDHHPAPEHLAAVSDQWQSLLQTIPPRWRQALTMLRDGCSHREVAGVLGISERTLGRILARARQTPAAPT